MGTYVRTDVQFKFNMPCTCVCTVQYSTAKLERCNNAVCCMLNDECSDHKDQSLDGFWNGMDAMNFQKFKCSRSTKFL